MIPDPTRYTRSASRLAVAAVIAGFFFACTTDTVFVPTEPAPVYDIVIAPPSGPLPAGVPTQIVAVARDSAGHVLSGHNFAWSSSNEGVARVSSTGEVTGVTPGTATISATTEGKIGTVSISVVVGAAAAIQILPSAPDVFRATSRQLSVTVRDVIGNVLPQTQIEWSSSNAVVLPVTLTGLVTAAGTIAGESDITARAYGLSATVRARIPVISTIQLGYGHGCLLTDRGRTYCWGENIRGQLGTGVTTNDTSIVPRLVVGQVSFTKLSVGQLHNCGLTADGTAYCWGWNAGGQIGDGSLGGNRPTPIAVSTSLRFTSVSAGQSQTCGITAIGETYCWGDGSPTPSRLPTNIRFLYLAAGVGVTCGLDDSGHAWCWASGTTTPVAVPGGHVFKSIDTASWGFKCGLTPDGMTYCWGYLEWRMATVTEPEEVPGGLHFTAIAAGANQLCGLTAAQRAYCIGNGFEGQLGDGQRHEPATTSFVEVLPGTPPASGFAQITAGESASCAVSVEGSPYCWGYWSRLGAGVDVRQTSPVLLKSP